MSATVTAGRPFSGDCFLLYCRIFFSLLTSAQAHWPIRKGLVPIKLTGPLTSQNWPLTSQFFVQYFLTVRIDPAKYEFLCMPESCSDPSVCTQETAAHLKIHRASHLRCAPGYRCNDINCLITGNPNSIQDLRIVKYQYRYREGSRSSAIV